MSEPVMMTRAEIEFRLAKKYVGRIVTFTDIRNREISGKIHRLAVEPKDGELMIIFVLGHDKTRYEVDIIYFVENIILHGNTPGTGTTDTRV